MTRHRAAARAVPLGRRKFSTSSPRRAAPAVSAFGGRLEAARYIGRRSLPGCTAYGDEIAGVSPARERRRKARFLGKPQHRGPPTSPTLRGSRERHDLGRLVRSGAGADLEMVVGIRGLHIVPIDGRDYFEVRTKGADAIAHARAGIGPVLVHATVTRPYAHSLSDDQKKYRGADELRDETEHDPITLMEHALLAAGAIDSAGIDALKESARAEVRAAADAALAAPRPDPITVIDHVFGPPPVVDEPPEPASAGETGRVRRSDPAHLHEEMARRTDPGLRRRRRRLRPRAARRRRGQGRRVRHHVRSAAHVRRRALLQHAARGGQHHRTRRRYGDARLAAVSRDPVLRLRVARDAAAQVGGRDDTVAFERRVHVPARRAHRDRRLPHRRIHLALALRRGDLRPHPRAPDRVPVARPRRRRSLRTAFRCEDPVLFLEHKHLYRQGYNRDPMPPAGWMLPFGKGAYVTRGRTVVVGAHMHRAVSRGGAHGVEIIRSTHRHACLARRRSLGRHED